MEVFKRIQPIIEKHTDGIPCAFFMIFVSSQNHSAIKKLIENIRRFVDLGEDEISVLEKYSKELILNSKDFLLTQGQSCRELYFVEKGCLRMYYITRRSTEQITQFAIDGWWIADYFSFMDKTASEYYIQCIEKCKVVSINADQLDQLLKELPQLERYFRIIMQRTVAANQHRSKLMYEMSKEEFYQHFCTSFPEFMQRVPQYMVASYLGLTPEYVSELRKKLQ